MFEKQLSRLGGQAHQWQWDPAAGALPSANATDLQLAETLILLADYRYFYLSLY